MPNPSNPYSEMLPQLPPDEYQRLRDDIADNGVQVPIIVDDAGNILDGRHRWLIAQELGVDCPVGKPVVGLADHDKRLLAVAVNVKRRHLTDMQQAAVGEVIEPDIAERARRRQGSRTDLDPTSGTDVPEVVRRRDEVAAEVGLGSGRTYERHKALRQEIKAEFPDLLPAIDAGIIEVDGKPIVVDAKWARKQVATRKAKAKQDEMSAAQSFVVPTLTTAPAAEWLTTVKPQSVDLLITDPPYATDVDDIAAFAESWVDAALDLVKPTGRAYICTGAYPAELHAYLTVLLQRSDMILANVLAWHYPDTLGNTPKYDYKSSWQAIFYLRGPEAPELNNPVLKEATTVQVVNMNSGVVGGRVHSWQKPDALAERLILHATQPGDVVADCFAGTGTFLVTAGRLGRVGIGCEVNRAMVALAMERGCHVEG
jgi:ParB-like chromosome segregation protein Spo0J